MKTAVVFFLCQICCCFADPDGRNRTLLLLSNSTSGTISLVNITAAVAGAWDSRSNLSSVFNGRNGSFVVYNVERNTGVYVVGNDSDYIWNSSRESWANFSQRLNLSQPFYWERLNGTFNRSAIPQSVQNEISNALSNWTPLYRRNLFLQRNPFETFANSSSALFNMSLPNLLLLMERRAIALTYEYFWLMNFFQGLNQFFTNLRGGFPYLLNRGFLFNPYYTFSALNGIDAFVALLQALQSVFDTSRLLNQNLNRPQIVSRLLNQLGGDSCGGVNGRLRSIYERLNSRNQTCDDGDDGSLENEWNQSVNNLNNATRNLGPRFRGLRNFAGQLGRPNERRRL